MHFAPLLATAVIFAPAGLVSAIDVGLLDCKTAYCNQRAIAIPSCMSGAMNH